METVSASVAWTGPKVDAFTVFIEPTPSMWAAEPVKPGDKQFYVYKALDSERRRTDKVAGVHITNFMEFERWDDLPAFDLLWQLPYGQAFTLEDLLKMEQQKARQAFEQQGGSAGEVCV